MSETEDAPRLSPLDRRHFRRGIYLLPSLFTVGNMFCGYACIMFAMRGDLVTAAPFIGIAIILDMLDGRIARMTNTTSAFGLQFDSLADVISFGMAPAILAFTWGLEPLGRLGWAAGFLFVSAAAMLRIRKQRRISAASRLRLWLAKDWTTRSPADAIRAATSQAITP